MRQSRVPDALRRFIAERAGYRCEYCLVPQHSVLIPHQPDHIIALQHGGTTTSDNLALACLHCNRRKGPNIASIDSISGQLTALFNPRTQNWHDHFFLEGVTILARSAVGRVTIQLLDLNATDRVELRASLFVGGRYE
ncbi:MAG: HNH endonuclease [Caldilineales bacterium]|nr:HNH endonuclease [Caldilineales bacterium]